VSPSANADRQPLVSPSANADRQPLVIGEPVSVYEVCYRMLEKCL
jgi:hypothetical protein